jgi:hypothetical protein
LGFTSGLQQQIGNGSQADGDEWPMLHAMMADGSDAGIKRHVDEHILAGLRWWQDKRRRDPTTAAAKFRVTALRRAGDVTDVSHAKLY